MPRDGAKFERPLNEMYDCLRDYAEAYMRRYSSVIGEDAVLGEAWITAVRSLCDLLNGETGLIDCGAFDRKLRDLAELNGFTLKLEDK